MLVPIFRSCLKRDSVLPLKEVQKAFVILMIALVARGWAAFGPVLVPMHRRLHNP